MPSPQNSLRKQLPDRLDDVRPVEDEKQPMQNGEEPDQTRNTRGRMFWLAVAIVAGLTLLPVPIALLATLDAGTLAGIMCPFFVLFLFSAVVGGIAWELFFKKGRTLACPHCKKWWARVQVGEQAIESKKCYGLVTRRASSSSSGFGLVFGNHHTYSVPTYSSSSTRWKERVPVVRTIYLLIYECKFCCFRWTREKAEEVEDFDIER